jgi:multidrug transporter EmrE-like cation transporter
MGYVMLMGAIFSEIFASTFLRLSRGFEEQGYGAVSLCLFSMSLFCLSKAIKVVPLSIAYSLWAGMGIAGTLAAGYLVFDESIGAQQVAGTMLILIGAIVVRASAAG